MHRKTNTQKPLYILNTHTYTHTHTPDEVDTLRNSSTGSVTALGRLKESRKEPFLSRLPVLLRERLRSITRLFSSTRLRLCLQEQAKRMLHAIIANLHRPWTNQTTLFRLLGIPRETCHYCTYSYRRSQTSHSPRANTTNSLSLSLSHSV